MLLEISGRPLFCVVDLDVVGGGPIVPIVLIRHPAVGDELDRACSPVAKS